MKPIITRLKQIEAEYGIQILYACETGSRAWGFPSPDSDFDIRFIYMHPRDWYLSLSEKKDSIEIMDGEWDITGWDLRKCLRMLQKSNIALIERFQSPVVYIDTKDFRQSFSALIPGSYSPIAAFFHHHSLAVKFREQMKEQDEVRLKGFFYLLRSLLSCYWIINDSSVLPMDIEGLMTKIEKEKVKDIRDLIDLKATVGESYRYMPGKDWFYWIDEHFDKVEKAKDNLGVAKGNADGLNDFFLKMVNDGTNDR